MIKEIGTPNLYRQHSVPSRKRVVGRVEVVPLHEFYSDLKKAENEPPKPIEIGRPLERDRTQEGFGPNNGKYGKVIHPDNVSKKDRGYINLRNAITRSLNKGEYEEENNKTRAMVEEMFNTLTEPQMIARRRR